MQVVPFQTVPLHRGEIEAQEAAGERMMGQRVSKMLRDVIPPRALGFIDQQPFVIVSSQASDGAIWASALVADKPFMRALNSKEIEIDRAPIISSPSDPLWRNIEDFPKVGLLFIDLQSRMRIRVNGRVEITDDTLKIAVEQAYPNCPKFIQRRELNIVPGVKGLESTVERGHHLESEQIRWITKADTTFVASSDNMGNLDASHRGGNPGFIEVVNDTLLRIPDYPGNSLFNTLGNFMVNPYASLLFIDFESGKTLQLTGEATILWDEDGAEEKTGGTKRMWEFTVSEWMITESLNGFHWHLTDYSPFNP